MDWGRGVDHMARALELAESAIGLVSPNPAVGAVIVKNGELVGEGRTQPPGGPHAEIVALEGAGDRAQGATMYVTLEPCSFQGRTPPCTRSLISAGIAEVHIATIDPHPRVNGQGAAELRSAGIKVVLGEHGDEARELNEPFFKWATTGHPLVIAKYAMTLDGKIATADGDSRWITGEGARRRVHEVRSRVDAVMVGIGTVLADDPELTVRIVDNPAQQDRQPLRVVVDSRCRMPASYRLAGPELASGTLLVTTPGHNAWRAAELREAGLEVVEVTALEDGRVDLNAVMSLLSERGVTSVLVEGGGTVLASLFEARLVDKVMAFVAPKIVGGALAPSPVEGEGVALMADAVQLRRARVEQIGKDVLITGYTGAWGCESDAGKAVELSGIAR